MEIPVIQWQTTTFAFHILTSLSISGVIFNGSSVHVANRTLCPTAILCCQEASAYENISHICSLRGKTFVRSSQSIFEGFFILNRQNASLSLQNVTFANFYAVINYNSLIYSLQQNSTILINASDFINVFFVKGLIDSEVNSGILGVLKLENGLVSQWNSYNVTMDFGNNMIFGVAQTSTIIFYLDQVTTSIQNISFIDTTVGHIFNVGNLQISLNSLIIQNLNGSFIKAGNSFLTISEVFMDNVIYGPASNLAILEGYILNLLLSNCSFSNIIGCGFYLNHGVANLNNFLMYNISFPSNVDTNLALIFMTKELSNITLDKMNVSEIMSPSLILIAEFIKNFQFLIKNSIFENINATLGNGNCISWADMTVFNTIFINIINNGAIFSSIFVPVPILRLLVKSCYFININGANLGTISVSSWVSQDLTFEDSSFEIISGKYGLFLPTTALAMNFVLKNLTFKKIFIDGMGFIIFLNNNYTLILQNCTFTDILFNYPVMYRGIIVAIESNVVIESCIFSKINMLTGNGIFILAQRSSNITINNSVIEELYIEGKGGISLSEKSRFIFNCSVLKNSRNSDEGFMKLTDHTNIQIQFSVFRNLSSLKYSLFYIQNFENLTISHCEISDIRATVEGFIWISSIYDENTSFAELFNNKFENNSANVGGLSFIQCKIPIFLINNSFSGCFSENGGCLYAENVKNLYINHCQFRDSYASIDGAVLFFRKIENLEIKYCDFWNNTVIYGKGGNIYLEDSNFTIENTNFIGGKNLLYQSEYTEGSALYVYYSSFFSISLKNCKFTDLFQDSNVIFVTCANKALASLEFQGLNFSGILSRNGNGVFTLIQCVGIINETRIDDSILLKDGNFIDIFHKSIEEEADDGLNLHKITIIRLFFKNNTLKKDGFFLSIMYINNVRVFESEFSDNSLKNSIIQIKFFSNFSLNTVKSSNNLLRDNAGISRFFAQIMNGTYIQINAINFTGSIGLFLLIQSIEETASITDINVMDHIESNYGYFIFIENSTRILMKNWIIANSNISSLEVFCDILMIDSIKLQEINLTLFPIEIEDDNLHILYISSRLSHISQNGVVSIDKMLINSIEYGVIIEKVDNVNIRSFFYDNSLFNRNSFPALKIKSISSISIDNSTIINITMGSGIVIKNSDISQFGTINFFDSLIKSCGFDSTGGLNITGNFIATLSSVKLDSNRGSIASAFSFYSFSNYSNLSIETCEFQDNPTASLIIPNDTFYSDFLTNNKEFLLTSQLNFTSYAHKIKAFAIFNQSSSEQYNENDVISLYSGQQIDLQFIAYDHFDQISESVDYMTVEILQKDEDIFTYDILKSKAIFLKSSATILSFAILIKPENIPKQPLHLQVGFGGRIKNNALFVEDYNFSMFMLIKPCDIGHVILNNVCTECDSKGYSLDENPSNLTQCKACPANAICEKGQKIVPKFGFWNLNDKDTDIIQCENEESCNVTCLQGYFGYLCHECMSNYGKTLIRKCVGCEDSYYTYHLLRTILKWFVLALVCYYESLVIKDLSKENNQIILAFINIFVYHSNILAMTARFQNAFPIDYENFFEVQSVFSFLENDIYGIYCVFPELRDYKFIIAVFMYILMIACFQFLFILIIWSFLTVLNYLFKGKKNSKNSKEKKSSKERKSELLNAICLVFANNFITLFYYFIGLVFYYGANEKIPIFFMELGVNTGQFFIILFLILFPIFLIFAAFIFYFMNKNKSLWQILVFDIKYKKDFKAIGVIPYICLFLTILLSHYSFVGTTFSAFAKNIFMIYLGVFAVFNVCESKIVRNVKILSIIILVVSFFKNYKAIIVLNSFFYVVIFGLIIKKSLFETKKKLLKVEKKTI